MKHLIAIALALAFAAGCAKYRNDPCRLLPPGTCTEPTPRPTATRTPCPDGTLPGQGGHVATCAPTPTPEPTATAAPEPTATPVATATPPATKPETCSCVVTVAADILGWQDANRKQIAGPVAGGYVTSHATVRFERSRGDTRGGPCDTPEREASTCSGRKCDPATGPDWWASVPECPEGVEPTFTCWRALEDGWLIRVGPLEPGVLELGTVWPANWHDQEWPARSLVRCPQVPDSSTHDRVRVVVP